MDTTTNSSARALPSSELHWLQPLDEGFRLLALNVLQLLPAGESEHRGHSLVVLSAYTGEGRSRVAASLARALAELQPPVVLIDADQIGSGLSHLLDTDGWPGEQLTANVSANGDGRPSLSVMLPDRQRPAPRVAYLAEIQEAMAKAAGSGAIAVVDAPACTASSVGFYLAAYATGVIYVAGRSESDEAVHRDVRGQLELQGARVLGVVLNEP